MLFSREDWTLFRSLETLSQKAGVPSKKIPALVAKELADNALDVCGNCTLGRTDGGFWIADDGPGIEPDIVAELFSIKRPLLSSKLLRLPTRGALGNGLRVVTGAVLAMGGTLNVSTSGQTFRLIPQDDGQTLMNVTGYYDGIGTKIEVNLNRQVDLSWAERAKLLAAGDLYKGKTSAYWYTSEAFHELAMSADCSVRHLVALFDGCSGSKVGKISAAYKNRQASALTWEETDDLLKLMREYSSPVKPERIGCIGPLDCLPPYFSKTTGVFALSSSRGYLFLGAEIPFVVEVWVDFSDEPNVFVHVNKTPITGDVRAYHSKNDLGIYGCGLGHAFSVGRRPLTVWLNIQTPYMPITTDGKEPNFSPIVKEINVAITKAVNKAKRQAAISIVKTRTQKDIILENLEYAVDKASGGGEYRFSLRQLFYAIRPFIIKELGKEPDYDYFAKVITDHETEAGDIPGMYRDPRGILYHPHLQEDIQLGTLAVENYQRPAWTFNKILYSEKEGFFSILKSTKWPERHDCALLTSKGFASRAARDVLDLLVNTDEEILFFCIHDADAAGTMIYQSLQEGTAARPGRKVKVINLGLEPLEALEMGLDPEKVERKGTAPVADYVPAQWKQWLQANRVELNAMTTPQFLNWLDIKMGFYGNGKLIPPEDVMAGLLSAKVKERLSDKVKSRILEEAGYVKQVEEAVNITKPVVQQRSERLQEEVRQALEKVPEDHWVVPVEQIAEECTEKD